jgi:DNA-binding LacI/PurR family transcriptional regulator
MVFGMKLGELTFRRQLHWDLAERLRQHVRTDMAAGDMLGSVRNLAKDWGVSIAVVRAAQALLCQEGVLEVRQGKGVRVTGGAGRRRVGLYSELDLLHPRASSFHAVVMRLVRDELERRGVQTECYLGRTQPGDILQEPTCPRFLDDLANHRLDGVVFVDRPVTGPWDQLVRDLHIPRVGAGTDYGIDFDYAAFVREGLRQLALQGSRRVAMLSWADASAEDAFLATAPDLGLAMRPGWLRHDLHPQHAGAGWEEFREVWAAHAEKPDGLLVCDDVLFAEAATAMAEVGIRVPEQLRVVSHRNEGDTRRWPFPVTWIEFSPGRAAEALVTMILNLLTGEAPPPCQMRLPFAVVEPERQAASPPGISRAGNGGAARKPAVSAGSR